MFKTEFLDSLEKALAGLPREDVEERLNFYSEMIDDRIEEGVPEYQAVAEMGSVEDIAAQTLEDIPLAKLVKDKVKPKRSLRAGEIILLVLGSPIWLPLLLTGFVLLLTLYIVLWVTVVCLWIVAASLAAAGIGAFAAGIVSMFGGKVLRGVALIGAGMLLAGIAIFMFFGCVAATKGAGRLTARTALWIKRLIVGKEKNK